MPSWGIFEAGYMRSALFITNDENLMNRIKIMVHDEAAQFFYANTIDDAVLVMDEQEIAVVFMPYGLDVLSGDEMLEIILDHNPKAQIILLFDEEDLLDVIRAHNTYHICKLIASNNVKLELLPEKLDAAFERYNKDDEIKEFEKDYRVKEDKYKSALADISSLLNDRMNSYEKIRSFFLALSGMYLSEQFEADETESIKNYLDILMQEYISLFLIRETETDTYLEEIMEHAHESEEHRYLMINCDLKDLSDQDRLQCLYVIRAISRFFTVFYEKYRGKIETEGTDAGTVLNIVYEGIVSPAYAGMIEKILPFNEAMIKHFSKRAVAGKKDRILQYKLIYNRN